MSRLKANWARRRSTRPRRSALRAAQTFVGATESADGVVEVDIESPLQSLFEKKAEAHTNCGESLRLEDRAPRSENDLALGVERKVVRSDTGRQDPAEALGFQIGFRDRVAPHSQSNWRQSRHGNHPGAG